MENLIFGSSVVHLQTVDSTNNYAANLILQPNVAEGTVIMADFQSDGRGQRGNHWQSEPGSNLTVSYILYPVFLYVNEQFVLSKAVALGIADLLTQYGCEDVQIKWPNDVMVCGRKIAGILIENSVQGSAMKHAVVGIGLNVNQSSFPDGLSATSLALQSGEQQDLKRVLQDLSSCLQARYLQIRAHDPRIDPEYMSRLIGRTEAVGMRTLDGTYSRAIIQDIENSGRLVVDLDGERKAYSLEEIKLEI